MKTILSRWANVVEYHEGFKKNWVPSDNESKQVYQHINKPLLSEGSGNINK